MVADRSLPLSTFICGKRARFKLGRLPPPGTLRYCRNRPLALLMEHPCHKCGQAVEDGIPFCSHCGAPQIRVAVADLEPEQSAASEIAFQPAINSLSGPLPAISGRSRTIYWPQGFRAAALAGCVAGLGL